MEHVSEETLQTFSLRQFLTMGAGRRLFQQQNELGNFHTAETVAEMSSGRFVLFVESLSWLRLGIEIGFFARLELLDLPLLEAVSRRLKDVGSFNQEIPEPFRFVSALLLLPNFVEILYVERREAQGLFQAALFHMESVRARRLLRNLLRELPRPEASILDEPLELKLGDVYRAIQANRSVSTSEAFAAGWLELLQFLHSFSSIYTMSPDIPLNVRHAGKLSLTEIIGALMSHYLNPFSERATTRLQNLSSSVLKSISEQSEIGDVSLVQDIRRLSTNVETLIKTWINQTSPYTIVGLIPYGEPSLVENIREISQRMRAQYVAQRLLGEIQVRPQELAIPEAEHEEKQKALGIGAEPYAHPAGIEDDDQFNES